MLCDYKTEVLFIFISKNTIIDIMQEERYRPIKQNTESKKKHKFG